MARPRIIQLVHQCPGRVRLRLPWLRDDADRAEAIAEVVAGLDPSVRVEVRPWTGSVLCTYDPERLDADRVLDAVRRHTRIAAVVRGRERNPQADAEYARAREAGVGTVTRSVAHGMRELNRDVLRATEGRLDLGSVAGLGFLTAGAAEIATLRSFPAPPWFNLAWWAFRTFTLFGGEGEEDGEAEAADAADSD